MTFGRVAEALPQAIGCVSWQKLVKSFFFLCFVVLRTQFLSSISSSNILKILPVKRSCFSHFAFDTRPVASRLVCLARVRSCSKVGSLRGPQQTSAGGLCDVACPNGWNTVVDASLAVQMSCWSTVLIASAGICPVVEVAIS